jgi:hypothetical protein
LGCNFFGYRIGGSGVWIHGRRCGRGGNREIPVLYLPGSLPDFLHYRHNGRQKNAIIQDRSVKTMWAWEAAEKKSARLPPGERCASLLGDGEIFVNVTQQMSTH